MIFGKYTELKKQGFKIGITFSQFDLLHAGHVAMLAEVQKRSSELKDIQSYLVKQIQLEYAKMSSGRRQA